MSELLDDLRSEIAKGHVLAIVGAGVSIGATGGDAVASWAGLVKSGIDRCVEVAQPLPTRWAERVREELESGDLDDLLSAAEKISAKLGAPAGGEYRRWLRETVGQLKIQDRSVIEALRDLEIPLATTNYDGLLEEVTGRPPVTWREGAKVERVIRGDEPGILHLHGYWDEPESVVLGLRSYGQILSDAHAQTVQRALRTTRSFLLVGCGEGLSDPNFGALLLWSRSVFAGSEYRHFRLCLDSEVVSIQAKHPPEERIFVRGYGAHHKDLAPFLQSLKSVKKRQEMNLPRASFTGLGLAVVFVFLAILWFERHLDPYARFLLTGEGTFLGALAVAIPVTYGIFKAKINERAESFLLLLNKPGIRKMVGGGIFLILILLFATSSIHINTEALTPGENCKLQIKKNGQMLGEPVVLTHNSTHYFRLLWFSRPGSVSVDLLKPVGYAAFEQQLGVGGTIRLHVPADFKPREFHVLRLVPGGSLLGLLPPVEEKDRPAGSSYWLQIRFPNQRSYRIRWYRQAIYIGAGEAELKLAATDPKNANWLSRLEESMPPLAPTEKALLLQAANNPLYFPTIELSPRDRVDIDLIFVDGSRSETHYQGSYTPSSDQEPKTVLLPG